MHPTRGGNEGWRVELSQNWKVMNENLNPQLVASQSSPQPHRVRHHEQPPGDSSTSFC